MEFHEAANIFPMDESSLQDLSDDIGRNGQVVPIEIFEGKILDGRRRFKACKMAGVEPMTKNVKVDNPVSHVLSLNLHRRHLDQSQKSMVAARAREVFDVMAKDRMHEGQERGRQNQKASGANLPQTNSERGPRSRDLAAKAVGVGGRTVDYATKVLNEGTDELIEAVDKGEIAVSKAAEIAKLPAEEQAKEIDREMSNEPKPIIVADPQQGEIKLLGKGIMLADEAINCLNRIPKNDALRRRGLQRVTDWIKRNQ